MSVKEPRLRGQGEQVRKWRRAQLAGDEAQNSGSLALAVSVACVAISLVWASDRHVGVGGANLIEDVQLVQLAYTCFSQQVNIPRNLLAIYSKVIPGERYTGKADDPLSVAIRAHEKDHGGQQDGWVTPLPSSGLYHWNNLTFTYLLAALNVAMEIDLSDKGGRWPSIDQHPKARPLMKHLVARVFGGF